MLRILLWEVRLSLDEFIHRRQNYERSLEPINRCGTCSNDLSAEDIFIVAKAYDKGRCILETAQCLSCQMQLRHFVSEQSMENLQLYKGRRFEAFTTDPFARRAYFLEDPTCIITGEEIEKNGTFEIYTLNGGSFGDPDENYFFVGGTAIEQMTGLLSEETRRHWEGFLSDLQPSSPEVIVPTLFG